VDRQGSHDERRERGRTLRETVPRASLGEHTADPGGRDPVAILRAQGVDRVVELLPIRYGRMASSPFSFFRGAAAVMAHDLASSPTTGLIVQACGDAHLANLGIFATPERNVVFDLNDFDETIPGPWEWDLERLAASFEVAARHRRMSVSRRRTVVTTLVRSYAAKLRQLAAMSHLDVWYSHIPFESIVDGLDAPLRTRAERELRKAQRKDRFRAQERLTEVVDGHRRFVEQPPLQQRVAFEDHDFVQHTFDDYLDSLTDDRRTLLGHYDIVDVALRVVGVGSVGTRCFVVLLEGRDDDDPLVLQIKQATESVLAPHVGASRYENHGQRVVEGQRLIQASSDPFLGWMESRLTEGRHFYWRQLYDTKGAVDLETIDPTGLVAYADVCGAALARAHARSGDAAAISGYVGKGGQLADAIGSFAAAYAEQTERDHELLVTAIADGRVEAVAGI
jgi:uncharacterized protein (DUF2252 family)